MTAFSPVSWRIQDDNDTDLFGRVLANVGRAHDVRLPIAICGTILSGNAERVNFRRFPRLPARDGRHGRGLASRNIVRTWLQLMWWTDLALVFRCTGHCSPGDRVNGGMQKPVVFASEYRNANYGTLACGTVRSAVASPTALRSPSAPTGVLLSHGMTAVRNANF